MKATPLLCACLLLAGCSHPDESAPKAVVAVTVARAELADVRFSVRAPATLFPKEQANIAARITAPIRELRARKGDRVSAGQVVAKLEDRDVLAQRAEAAAMVEDAQASLQKISAGTIPAELERARGQLAAAEAQLNQAQKIFDRRSELFNQGAIPARDLLVSQTELATARSNDEVARRTLELLERQSRAQDLRIAESRVAQAKARLGAAEAQLQFTELRSPFAGSVTEQFLYPGDMAKPEFPVFTIMDLSVVIARAQVPESDVAAVALKQPCRFQPADAPDRSVEGRVSVVSRAVDPARRTVEVWCELPDAGQALRAGVFGNVVIYTGTESGALVVPLRAVQFSEGTRKGVALVVDAKNIAHRKEVEAGEVTAGKVRITSGLSPGDRVVVEGGYGLPDGTEVRFVEAKK